MTRRGHICPIFIWGGLAAISPVFLAVQEPDVIKQLAIVGVEPRGGGPGEFDRVLKGETERIAKVVKSAEIRLD